MPAGATPQGVACSLAVGSYVTMTVTGPDVNLGVNNGGGPRNYYLLTVDGQTVGATQLLPIIVTFPASSGPYDGIVDYANDNGRSVKLTTVATCTA